MDEQLTTERGNDREAELAEKDVTWTQRTVHVSLSYVGTSTGKMPS